MILTIPYIAGLSESIQRVCRDFDIKTAFKSYLGETTRMLEQRVKEHQDACKRGDEKVSAIAEHAWQQHHPIKWEEVRVAEPVKIVS